MKKIILSLCLLGGGLLLPAQTVIDEIIASVAGQIITQYDLEYALQSYKYQNGIYSMEDEDAMRCQILEQLIFQKLLIDQAKLDSIEITEDQITQRIESSIRMQVAKAGSVKRLEDAYGKTLAEIKKDARQVVRDDYLMNQMQQNLTSSINVTYQDVRDYYQQVPKDSLPVMPTEYELAVITRTPQVSEGEKAALKERLNGYRTRILKGENFSTFARLYSEDPGSAAKGGELGFVNRGELYPEFEQVAFNLQPGEVSPIVETKAGYHIIRMIERRGDQANVAHILLKPKPTIDSLMRCQQYLDSVARLIRQGGWSFDSAARSFSDDPNKINGGKLANPYTGSSSWTQDQLDQTTLYTLKRLKEGECSNAIPYITEEGNQTYRLVLVAKIHPEHPINLTDDYEKIKNAALEAKKQKALVKWATHKARLTHIEINEGYRRCDLSENLGITF
ncbi:MAG: peptidylprolyl isomerase [Bacteroidales bacterium]|nr:peptidylprolyl isomerase [Bacteroidales bacterium]